MSLHVILGITISTSSMISALKSNGVTTIMVLDHDHEGEEQLVDGVIYLSPDQTKDYVKENKNVVFHQFLHRGHNYLGWSD